MPSISEHRAMRTTKALVIGDSGTGKTGALAALVDAGYKLGILDFDNGLEALINYTVDKKLLNSNVFFETLTDKLKASPGGPIPDGTPKAFGKALKLMDNWPELGPVKTWGDEWVLVVDSLTFMGQAAMRYIMSLAGRGTSPPQIQDWGNAMRLIENSLALLFSEQISCNVIVNSHITYVEGDSGVSKGYPSALGSKLPPKVGRYFNTVVLTKTVGKKRVFRTVSDGMIEVKLPVRGVEETLPIESGLLTILEAVKAGGVQ